MENASSSEVANNVMSSPLVGRKAKKKTVSSIASVVFLSFCTTNAVSSVYFAAVGIVQGYITNAMKQDIDSSLPHMLQVFLEHISSP